MKYKIEIEKNGAENEVYYKQPGVPLFLLLRAVEKREIESFKISLD